MRIGVVSDTHNHLSNVTRIVEIFNGARVTRVVHTGDITQPKTLDVLSGLQMPLVGVYGNNDLERPALDDVAARHGFQLVDGALAFSEAGRQVTVVHDPLDIAESMVDECDLVLHGHIHRHVEERRRGALVFNPGECAGMMAGLNTVGLVDLATLDVELVRF
jgi:putative phosphoesterase